jgi:hypothetical protein
MEKNKPISVAFEDIRNNPDFIEHSEYRFINDDLGMVISFFAMGSRLFRTGQPYRAKEGRIIRIMQGSGRISINLIEYEATAHDIIIIPDNSLIEILEISPDYDFQIIMPARNFLPALPGSILSETYTGNGIVLIVGKKCITKKVVQVEKINHIMNMCVQVIGTTHALALATISECQL